ncbi:MAG: sulfatase [Lewinellaceae bacterium]|nr:sulfatase [Phaeodactylibacter sp.]MCB0613013.1 sulfatase [Phaeodactylibacter sp.]MCB9351709.1 sulfatase [Lewinellaceae bacterium]
MQIGCKIGRLFTGLAALWGMALWTTACGVRPANHEGNRPPNILLLLADDWSYPHAGVYGDKVAQTPTFDRLAAEGVLFTNAYCSAPSCSPSRAAILTGQYPHRLEQGANLWGTLDRKFATYTQLLERQGYFVGMAKKGWGPGNFEAGGYEHNPAGKGYASFQGFYEERPNQAPFCFWFGSRDPHRPYIQGVGAEAGLSPDSLLAPPFLIDLPVVQQDLLDYYYGLGRFDQECGEILSFLEKMGALDNTIVVMTSDNGMPFPRCKANLYDYGARVPLAISWKGKGMRGLTFDGFVNLLSLAPTFLDAARVEAPTAMDGKSLLPVLLQGENKQEDDYVYLERERHGNVRQGHLGYPARAIRDDKYLYIRNLKPGRWPAGDPELADSGTIYGDVDDSPSKFFMMHFEGDEAYGPLFELSFGKRPREELYQIESDPFQMTNLAGISRYRRVVEQYARMMDAVMAATDDPWADPRFEGFDQYPYYGKHPFFPGLQH